MSKREKDKIIKKIEVFLGSVDWLFQLNNFHKHLVIKNEDYDDIAAEMEYREEYQDITVRIYPLFFKATKEDQAGFLLHELCHSITIPSKVALHKYYNGYFVPQQSIHEINETETSKIENIISGFLTGKFSEIKEAFDKYLE